MKTLQVCIECPSCSNCIALPRESHLGGFDDELNPSKDVWTDKLLVPSLRSVVQDSS